MNSALNEFLSDIFKVSIFYNLSINTANISSIVDFTYL